MTVENQMLGSIYVLCLFVQLGQGSRRRLDQLLCTRVQTNLFLTAAHGLWKYDEHNDNMQVKISVGENEYDAIIEDLDPLRESKAIRSDVPIRLRLANPPPLQAAPIMPVSPASYNMLDGITFVTVEWRSNTANTDAADFVPGTFTLHRFPEIKTSDITVDVERRTIRVPHGVRIMPDGSSGGPLCVVVRSLEDANQWCIWLVAIASCTRDTIGEWLSIEAPLSLDLQAEDAMPFLTPPRPPRPLDRPPRIGRPRGLAQLVKSVHGLPAGEAHDEATGAHSVLGVT